MAAVHSTTNRKSGEIYTNDHVQWFDPSTFELRHGVVGSILAGDAAQVTDDDGLIHVVPTGNMRLWCLAGQPRPVSDLTAQALTERILGMEQHVFSKQWHGPPCSSATITSHPTKCTVRA